MLSPNEISSIIRSLSKLPFSLSATFVKILTSALCTTNRIKQHDATTCFACGKAKGDLYRFLRHPFVAFIFKLPLAFGSLHKQYFPLKLLLNYLFSAKFTIFQPGSIELIF